MFTSSVEMGAPLGETLIGWSGHFIYYFFKYCDKLIRPHCGNTIMLITGNGA